MLHSPHVCNEFTKINQALNSKSQMASLDFTINRFFMKLFSTSNIEIVKSCQEFFGFELPSTMLSKRIAKFESVYYNP